MSAKNDPPFWFDRTTCACSTCVGCCKRQPGPLIPGDLERIAEFRGESVEEASKNFWASPGCLVKDGEGRTKRIGTITPKYDRKKKRCVFLDDNDRCTIHSVAPFGCSHFDTHLSMQEAHERSVWTARQQMDPEYQQTRNTLDAATHHQPLKYTV
jgi:Fe-S-cluster containining protein